MAPFQVSLFENHIELQSDQVIYSAFKKFTSYFPHPKIQENNI